MEILPIAVSLCTNCLSSAVSCVCCLELLSLGDAPAFPFTATATVGVTAAGTSGVAAATADDDVSCDDDNDNDDDDENGPWQSTRQNTGQNSQ